MRSGAVALCPHELARALVPEVAPCTLAPPTMSGIGLLQLPAEAFALLVAGARVMVKVYAPA